MSEEPVAYRVNEVLYNNLTAAEFEVKRIKRLRKDLNMGNGLIERPLYIEPLYKETQVRQKVQMTKKQYDVLMFDKKNNDLLNCIDYFMEHNGNTTFGLKKENLIGNLSQEDIARAWLNPEETIEIVPNMKWFVRSKKKGRDKYLYLKNPEDNFVTPWYTAYKDSARHFNTEDEANLWNNPQTEAVQLPVEGE